MPLRRIGPGGPFLVEAPPTIDSSLPFLTFVDWGERQRTQQGANQAGRAEVGPNLLLTTLAVAAAVVVLRGPIYSQQPTPRQPQSFEAPNLLLTTLSTLAAAPFIPEDFDQRRAPRRSSSDIDQQNIPLLVGVPFTSNDFSDPLRSQPHRHELWQQNIPLLVGVPFTSNDFSDPLRYGPRRDSIQSPNLVLFAPTGAVPFTSYDLSVVRAARGRDTWQSPLNLPIATVGVPFSQRDLTEQRRGAVRDSWVAPNLLLTTLAPTLAKPFAQYDWFVAPRSVTRATVEPMGTPLTLLSVGAPFRPFEGERRAQSRVHQAEDFSNLLTSTLSALPFRQFDMEGRRRIPPRRQDEQQMSHAVFVQIVGSAARTYTVKVEHREFSANVEHRERLVNAEQRTLTVNAERRTLTANAENRALIVNPEKRGDNI